jgi:hypothetical protein
VFFAFYAIVEACASYVRHCYVLRALGECWSWYLPVVRPRYFYKTMRACISNQILRLIRRWSTLFNDSSAWSSFAAQNSDRSQPRHGKAEENLRFLTECNGTAMRYSTRVLNELCARSRCHWLRTFNSSRISPRNCEIVPKKWQIRVDPEHLIGSAVWKPIEIKKMRDSYLLERTINNVSVKLMPPKIF